MTIEEFIAEWNNSDSTMLVHTSGSTGAPKAMRVEKQKMLNSARITCDFLGLRSGDTALLCMPLDFIAGKMMVVRSLERNLHLLTVKPSNHPLTDIEEKIDFAAMVPSQVFCSLQVPEERQRLRRINKLIIGGGAITRELQQELDLLYSSSEKDNGSAYSTYGMTETLSHIALRSLNGPDASEWYRPFCGVKLSQTDEGCLIINAPHVHDGTLVTNDIVELRDDGCFRIIGRKDNVICSGGIKLQIEQIEDTLRQHIPVPFCITKCPDEKFGEVAVILVAASSEVLSSDKIISLCHQHLPPYSIPKQVVHTDIIPMTATGKIDRWKAERIAK